MIAKVGERLGSKTLGLLAYLYGPGTNQEHTNPRLVASWDEREPDPRQGPDAEFSQRLNVLSRRLNELVLAHGRPLRQHVWHCSVRAAPDDRLLTDAEWAEVAREIVDAAGIAPQGDPMGCRWIAVRHAEDHIHIAATLRRLDGKAPHRGNERLRLRQVCNQVEQRLGLHVTAPTDWTASRRSSRAELGKAQRLNLNASVRDMLASKVRLAVARSRNEQEFFKLLAQAGLRVSLRKLDGQGEQGKQLVGYRVALPRDRNRNDETVWYAGSSLGPDLSLRRVRERWGGPESPSTGEQPTPSAEGGDLSEERVLAWRQAALAIERAAQDFKLAKDPQRAAIVSAVGDLLTVVAEHSPDLVRAEVIAAARDFERAARAPLPRIKDTVAQGLRVVARSLDATGRALSHGKEARAAVGLLVAVAGLVHAVVQWYVLRRLHAQQASAEKALGNLRLAAWHLDPVHLSVDHMAAQNSVMQEAVRSALPDGESVLAEPGWPKLAVMLLRARAAGLRPVELLGELSANVSAEAGDVAGQLALGVYVRLHGLPDQRTSWWGPFAAGRMLSDAEAARAWTRFGPVVAQAARRWFPDERANLESRALATALSQAAACGMDVKALLERIPLERGLVAVDGALEEETDQELSEHLAGKVTQEVHKHQTNRLKASDPVWSQHFQALTEAFKATGVGHLIYMVHGPRLIDQLQRADEMGVDIPEVFRQVASRFDPAVSSPAVLQGELVSALAQQVEAIDVRVYEPVLEQGLKKAGTSLTAEQVMQEEAWPAVVGTLRKAERGGRSAATLLEKALADRRGFSDAESVSAVLVWRIERLIGGGGQQAQGKGRSQAGHEQAVPRRRPTSRPPDKRRPSR